jgi:hypothetical protein
LRSGFGAQWSSALDLPPLRDPTFPVGGHCYSALIDGILSLQKGAAANAAR